MGLCDISPSFSACPGTSQGAGTHVQLLTTLQRALSPRAIPTGDPQVVAPRQTPEGVAVDRGGILVSPPLH